MDWIYLNSWDRCGECWAHYLSGHQHKNSLSCYKVGIPISSLRVPLEEFIEVVKREKIPAKYAVFDPPLSMVSRGTVILYFTSMRDALDFMSRIKHLIRSEPSLRDRLFYRIIVRVEWVGGFNYRRGCPEYDMAFGHWKTWPSRGGGPPLGRRSPRDTSSSPRS